MRQQQFRPPRAPGEFGAFAPALVTSTNNPYFFPIGGAAMLADNGAAGVAAIARFVLRDRDRNPLRNPVRIYTEVIDPGGAIGMTIPGGGFGTILSADPAADANWSWLVLPDSSGRVFVQITYANNGDKLVGVLHPQGPLLSATVSVL